MQEGGGRKEEKKSRKRKIEKDRVTQERGRSENMKNMFSAGKYLRNEHRCKLDHKPNNNVHKFQPQTTISHQT